MQPVWLSAHRYSRLSVHQTGCLGRINTGLQTNPSLQTLFSIMRNPEVLSFLSQSSATQEPSRLAVRPAKIPTFCFLLSYFNTKRFGKNKKSDISLENVSFLKVCVGVCVCVPVLVIAITVCVHAQSGKERETEESWLTRRTSSPLQGPVTNDWRSDRHSQTLTGTAGSVMPGKKPIRATNNNWSGST